MNPTIVMQVVLVVSAVSLGVAVVMGWGHGGHRGDRE